jgi:ATP-dependent Clp protease ATP-binding subunit ClpA
LALCEGGGVAEHALATLGATPGAVRAAVLQAVKPGTADQDESESLGGLIGAIVDSIGLKKPTVDLPYTSRAKKVLELAMTEARELNHSYVGTEHLLLGLLREERGIAAQVLRAWG